MLQIREFDRFIIFHAVRSKTKTNCDSLVCVFPRFSSATCISSFDWFTVSSVFFVIGYSDYFGFGFTTLD